MKCDKQILFFSFKLYATALSGLVAMEHVERVFEYLRRRPEVKNAILQERYGRRPRMREQHGRDTRLCHAGGKCRF